MSYRIYYFCKTCGKLRIGSLTSEPNNLNIPCECGSMHWTTEEPKTKTQEGQS